MTIHKLITLALAWSANIAPGAMHGIFTHLV